MWSPDGTRIAFMTGAGKRQLAVKPGHAVWTSHPDRLGIVGDLPAGASVIDAPALLGSDSGAIISHGPAGHLRLRHLPS